MNRSIPIYAQYGHEYAPAEPEYVYLETIETSPLQQQSAIQPHRHNDLYQLIWVERGSIEAILDDTAMSIRAPALFAVPPMVVHGFRAQEHTAGLQLSLGNDYTNDVVSYLDRNACPLLHRTSTILRSGLSDEDASRISTLFHTILHAYRRNSRYRRATLHAYMLLLFSEIIQLLQKEADGSSQRTHDRYAVFSKFERLCELHYREHWPLAKYAAALLISERTLQRTCGYAVGTTANDVLQQRVMLEAKRNLLYTDRPIADIGYMLGFEDPAHFTKFFAHHAHCAPTIYRDTHRSQR